MSQHFAQPLWLWPMAGLALLALLFGAWAALRPGVGIRVIGQKPLIQGFGMMLMLAGLGLGLAQPRWGLPEASRLTAVALLDVSRSMAAPDAPGGTRFDAATAQLQQLFREPRPGLRWGLSLLSGDEVPMVPPGEDRSLLRDALSTVAPGEVGSPGSSFGRVIPQVASQIPPGEPTILLLLSDGEETWEAEEPALQRAIESLKLAKLPLYALAYGGTQPVAVPARSGVGTTPAEPAQSAARPEFLRRLAEGSGGRLLTPNEIGPTLNQLMAGHLPLPAQRSLTPTHPEAGAWIALVGLLLWLLAAGQPLRRWRPVVGLLLALGGAQLQAQDLPSAPSPTHAPTMALAALAIAGGISGLCAARRRSKPVFQRGTLAILLATLAGCDSVQTVLEPVGDGRLKIEYTQGPPSLGMCGFYHKSYTYELDFLDGSGHYTPKNLRVRTGAAGSADSMVLQSIEGTVELNRPASVITISLFETTRDGQRAPLVINGRHKFLDKQR